MADYRALVSFSGKVVMAAGEVKALTDEAVISDLLRAGYIEEVAPQEATPQEVEASKPAKKKTRKKKEVASSED